MTLENEKKRQGVNRYKTQIKMACRLRVPKTKISCGGMRERNTMSQRPHPETHTVYLYILFLILCWFTPNKWGHTVCDNTKQKPCSLKTIGSWASLLFGKCCCKVEKICFWRLSLTFCSLCKLQKQHAETFYLTVCRCFGWNNSLFVLRSPCKAEHLVTNKAAILFCSAAGEWISTQSEV